MSVKKVFAGVAGLASLGAAISFGQQGFSLDSIMPTIGISLVSGLCLYEAFSEDTASPEQTNNTLDHTR